MIYVGMGAIKSLPNQFRPNLLTYSAKGTSFSNFLPRLMLQYKILPNMLMGEYIFIIQF